MEKSVKKEGFLAIALPAMLCCALWGSAFPCIKIGYRLFEINSANTADVILFAGMRFIVSGLLVLLIAFIGGNGFIKLKKDVVGSVLIVSMFQTILQYGFFYIGLVHTTGVKASIITGSNVFFVILISSLLFKEEKFTLKKFIGVAVGFVGVVLVNLTSDGSGAGLTLNGDGFVLIAAISYGFSSACLKKFSAKHSTLMLSAYQFLFGGIILLLFGLMLGGRVTHYTFSGIMMLLYLGFISAAAYSLWGKLLASHEVSKVAVYGFTNPVFGVIFSRILLPDENSALGLTVILALALVCTGIFIINSNGNEIRKRRLNGKNTIFYKY